MSLICFLSKMADKKKKINRSALTDEKKRVLIREVDKYPFDFPGTGNRS